jgi:hypothetical protein
MRSELPDSGKRELFESGAVRDIRGGKGRFDLLPPEALLRYAVHMENGAGKYDDRNWEKGMPISRFFDSAMRHMVKYLAGYNEEDHLAAAMWNIGCIMHFEKNAPQWQDLPNRLRLMEAGDMAGEEGTIGSGDSADARDYHRKLFDGVELLRERVAEGSLSHDEIRKLQSLDEDVELPESCGETDGDDIALEGSAPGECESDSRMMSRDKRIEGRRWLKINVEVIDWCGSACGQSQFARGVDVVPVEGLAATCDPCDIFSDDFIDTKRAGKISGTIELLPQNIPFRNGDKWSAMIDLCGGIVMNWPNGIEAELDMRLADGASFELLDDRLGGRMRCVDDGTVPIFLEKRREWSDFLKLRINGDGLVEGWANLDLGKSRWQSDRRIRRCSALINDDQDVIEEITANLYLHKAKLKEGLEHCCAEKSPEAIAGTTEERPDDGEAGIAVTDYGNEPQGDVGDDSELGEAAAVLLDEVPLIAGKTIDIAGEEREDGKLVPQGDEDDWLEDIARIVKERTDEGVDSDAYMDGPQGDVGSDSELLEAADGLMNKVPFGSWAEGIAAACAKEEAGSLPCDCQCECKAAEAGAEAMGATEVKPEVA